MKISIEIYAEKQLFVKPDSYVKTVVMNKGRVLENSRGADSYPSGCIVIPGKRIAGAGRESVCHPGGAALCAEAAPGAYFQLDEAYEDVVLIINTDIILDQGILTDCLGIRILNEDGFKRHVPFKRPDVEIKWMRRGTFAIPVRPLITAAI